MFGKKAHRLHPAEGDALRKRLWRDAKQCRDVMLLQSPVQVRFSADEVAVAFHRVVMPEGDLVRFLLDDPMAFQVADVEGRDIGKRGNERQVRRGRAKSQGHSCPMAARDRLMDWSRCQRCRPGWVGVPEAGATASAHILTDGIWHPVLKQTGSRPSRGCFRSRP
jgi:hypothetical protein